MALAALIAAYHDTGETGGPLRATLPLAGRTVIERQARLAAAVGAHPVVVLVERMTAELAAALDRLRSEGVSPILARSVADAATAVGPEDRLLLVGDGLVAETGHFTRMAAASGISVLTLPDDGLDDRHERIDAESRWAGLAMVDGTLLRETAGMLQDWDLQSTLLRRAVQAGARQYAVRDDSDGFLLIAESEPELADAEQRIVAAAGGSGRGWASRWLLAPIERGLTRLLMPSAVTSEWLYVAAVALTGVAAFLFAGGWLLAGLALLLLTTPFDGTAERLATVRLQAARAPRWWGWLMPTAAAAALLALAWSASGTSGWGCLVLAAAAILFLLAQHGEIRGREIAGEEWLAERKGMIWLALPFGAAGLWVAALSVLSLYAVGSFFWAQRQAQNGTPRSGKDLPR